LTITNDQLTLATTNGHHCVDGLKTSLHWLVDGSSRKDTRGLQLGTTLLAGLDGSLAINWVTKGINDTTKELNSNGNVNLLDRLALVQR
jgi:hypothetical protein